MFQEFLDLLKKPTTKLIELSSSEEIKKILIKALILAIILPILGLLTTVIHINKEYGYNEKNILLVIIQILIDKRKNKKLLKI